MQEENRVGRIVFYFESLNDCNEWWVHSDFPFFRHTDECLYPGKRFSLAGMDYPLRSPFGPPYGRSKRMRFSPACAGMTLVLGLSQCDSHHLLIALAARINTPGLWIEL